MKWLKDVGNFLWNARYPIAKFLQLAFPSKTVAGKLGEFIAKYEENKIKTVDNNKSGVKVMYIIRGSAYNVLESKTIYWSGSIIVLDREKAMRYYSTQKAALRLEEANLTKQVEIEGITYNVEFTEIVEY